MIEAIGGIILLLISGLIGQGNILAITAASYFVLVFCAAWILLAGIYREITTILFGWVAVYIVFILIRLACLGFIVAAYSQMIDGKPITYDVIFLSDGTSLSSAPRLVNAYVPHITGCIAALAVSEVISAWVLVGVICLGVEVRRRQWKEAVLASPHYY